MVTASFADDAQEQWRAIYGYAGAYEVSDLGRVRSADRLVRGRDGSRLIRGRLLRAGFTRNGYLHVSLWHENKGQSREVHRLVALAFVPNPGGLPEACHRDHVPTNNRASNLIWGTHADNMAQSAAVFRGRASSNPRRALKLCAADVVEIRQRRLQGQSYVKIARDFSIVRETSRCICIGRIWA